MAAREEKHASIPVTDPLDVFSEGAGALREIWPEYVYRSQQEDMARAVDRAVRESGVLLVEAGTGVGKTLAYLLPLLDYAERENLRVAVSTETRSLQQQILEKDLPIVERILGRRIHAELCLGASNYVCKRKLEEGLLSGSVGPEMADHIDGVLDWLRESSTGVRQEYRGYASPAFWSKFTRDPDDCLGSRCHNFDTSYYFLARERWRRARLLILNHSLLSAHLAVGGQLLPEFAALVVDEAHRFPEVFHRSFIESMSFEEMEEAFFSLGSEGTPALRALEGFRSGVLAAVDPGARGQLRIRGGVPVPAGEGFSAELARAEAHLERRLNDLASQSELGLGEDRDERARASLDQLETQARLGRLQILRRLLNALLDGPTRDQVLWIAREEKRERSNDRADYRIHLAPVEPAELVREKLYPIVGSVAFTSATLAGQGARPFDYIARELGLGEFGSDTRGGRRRELQLDSPFDYRKRCLLYLPADMPDPSQAEAEFHRAAAREVRRLADLSRGGAFVLFTSARSLREVQRLIEEELDETPEWELVSQLEAGPSPALHRFRSSSHAVLFGLATFWQGVDIPGDQLRLVTLVRLPFRVPDDPPLAARMERVEEQGGQAFRDLQLPQATLSIKQGFGRLIRSHADRGAVAILDPRLRTRRYGREILAALPPAARHDSFESLAKAWGALFSTRAR